MGNGKTDFPELLCSVNLTLYYSTILYKHPGKLHESQQLNNMYKEEFSYSKPEEKL